MLALALLAVAIGAMVVAAVHLARAGRRLSAALRAAEQRLVPLAEQLAEEGEVAGAELAALERSIAGLRAQRPARTTARGQFRGQ